MSLMVGVPPCPRGFSSRPPRLPLPPADASLVPRTGRDPVPGPHVAPGLHHQWENGTPFARGTQYRTLRWKLFHCLRGFSPRMGSRCVLCPKQTVRAQFCIIPHTLLTLCPLTSALEHCPPPCLPLQDAAAATGSYFPLPARQRFDAQVSHPPTPGILKPETRKLNPKT